MPHTTAAYPFEFKVATWAHEMSQRGTGRLRAFIVRLNTAGEMENLVFEQEDGDLMAEARRLQAEDVPHVFFDPLEDGMEYIWLSWLAISREIMERLVGRRFEPTDFEGRGTLQGSSFPESWGVMF